MQLLTGKEAAERVRGIISPKHQVHGYNVDLTVKCVYAVEPVGEVDFGGGEYRAAERVPLDAFQRRNEDKYRWWSLDRGAYFVEFNESLELAPDEIAFIEPDERLIRAGATHAPCYFRGHVEQAEVLMNVPTLRVSVKQNARISRLRVFRLTAAPAAASLSSAVLSAPPVAAPTADSGEKPAPRKGKKRK
jgi:deoxycytidine triphosphate deaminase